MQISRARFVEHFHITFQVHCLRRRPKRPSAPPPLHVAGCLYQWVTMGGPIHAPAITKPAKPKKPRH